MVDPSPEPATRPLSDEDDDGGLTLLVLRGGDLIRRPVALGDRITIGRGEAASLRLDDDSISRVHLELVVGEQITVTDLGSSNGTRIRGKRVEAKVPQRVALGELVVLGRTSLLVEGNQSADEPDADSSDGPMQRVRRLAERVAPSEISVVLQGETGVGKEVMARRIHELSGRAGPCVPINCASFSEALLESQLFGHEKGAFTGADAVKSGLLEAANGGTVFLDEVAEMSLAIQAKLLRALEDRKFFRVGGTKPIEVDVRFVCASNRDLRQAVADGAFRRDLFHRLAGIVLTIPPLRQRGSEIVPLARELIASAARSRGRTVELSPQAEAWLLAQPWEGNVRELRNVIERALVLGGDTLTVDDFSLDPAAEADPVPEGLSAEQRQEREQIVEALRLTAGNQTRAAKRLGISRRTLINRIEAYAIPRPQKD